MAEGVRLFSQETWKLVTEMRGVQLVEKYITQVSLCLERYACTCTVYVLADF